MPEQISPFGVVLLGFNQGQPPPCIGRLSSMPSLKGTIEKQQFLCVEAQSEQKVYTNPITDFLNGRASSDPTDTVRPR